MIFATKDIGQSIVAGIGAAYPTLKLCSFGDLAQLPGPDDLSNVMPGVIVRPTRTEIESLTTGRVRVRYTYEVFRLREFAPGEEVTGQKAAESDALAETLLDYVPTMPAGIRFEGSEVPSIDYQNEADDTFAALGFVNVSAVKINLRIDTQATR